MSEAKKEEEELHPITKEIIKIIRELAPEAEKKAEAIIKERQKVKETG